MNKEAPKFLQELFWYFLPWYIIMIIGYFTSFQLEMDVYGDTYITILVIVLALCSGFAGLFISEKILNRLN